ncbi:MAG: dual specificity protein phosphatase family protein [Deltaproteobacteria bacterium]|nr:dual specificity protein phosphatase family protein [Deltaproteobacteria bacterium]
MYWVTERLAIGGLSSVELADESMAILNLCEDQPYALPRTIDFCHKGFPDQQPFPLSKVWECVEWLDRHVSRGTRVLVHCAEGNSRSVSVALAYFIFKGVSPQQAKAKILAAKPFCTQAGTPTAEPLYFHEDFLAAWQDYMRRMSRPV